MNLSDINEEKSDCFEVAMASAFYNPNTYYIFRSISEQIEISVDGKSFVSTAYLTTAEINHIKKYYPFLDTINYKVRQK